MPPGSLGGRIVEALSTVIQARCHGFGGAYLPTWEMPLDNPHIWLGWNLLSRN